MRNSICEGPEVERNVANLRDIKEVHVAGAWMARESMRKRIWRRERQAHVGLL